MDERLRAPAPCCVLLIATPSCYIPTSRLQATPLVTSYDKYWPAVAISLAGATVAEAFTSQNDNVVLPLTAMILAIGTLWACYD